MRESTKKKQREKKERQKADRLQAQQRRRMALEGRKAGLTYQAIAERVGYANASVAYKAVQQTLAEQRFEPVKDLKVLQMERLQHMLVVLWPKVNAGDERSIMTGLAVMEKMDRLNGTDAPTVQEIHHKGAVLVAQGDKDEFINAMKRMAGIDQDGNNVLTADQVVPNALPSPRQDEGRVYPPGMGGPTEPVIWDAEVVDDVHTDRKEDQTPEDQNQTPKTYQFGVEPKGVNGNGRRSNGTGPDGAGSAGPGDG